jgi:putative ABC transport system permease protein
MLVLKGIRKDYKVGTSSYPALKGVDLSFRDNEFVSILGPSGSGKTTLLNIIGGLDHYTEGDLLIDNISTKDFTDRDWDTYRSHKVGFIFQSYNLIPQESILENVELALTIGGTEREERVERAKKALADVGLAGMENKKPNQLSGGQCQRVAIARALVNNPTILLADEPTGALDSVTSLQVMDLIKKISKDRLVIMVTHNPELAKDYSTRIVTLKDGMIENDTNPYTAENKDEKKGGSVQEISAKKSKMSWWTAFKLSAKNLLVKRKRTISTVIAASIGIIGVSAVLAVRDGVQNYIGDMQNEMLSGNPIDVAQSGMDLSKIVSQMSGTAQTDAVKKASEDGKINVNFLTEEIIRQAKDVGSSMITNNISQDYVDYVNDMPEKYYQDVVMKYGINPSYNIYTTDNLEGYEDDSYFSVSGIRAIATSILKIKLAETGYSSYASVITSYANVLGQSINSDSYLLSQYDIAAGSIAKKEDEIMLVLSTDEEVNDITLTLLGYFSQDQFLNLIHKFNGESYDEGSYNACKALKVEDILKKPFVYYPNNTVFTKNKSSLSDDLNPFLYSYRPQESWTNGMPMKITGILKPKANRSYMTLKTGFYYTPAFTNRYLADNASVNGSDPSLIVKFLQDYSASKGTTSGYPSGQVTVSGATTKFGMYYDYDITVDTVSGEETKKVTKKETGYIGGDSSSLSSILSMISGSSSSSSSGESEVHTITSRNLGGETLPSDIQFYPNSFESKNLITDYLDKWNSKNDITLSNGALIPYTKSDGKTREEIQYTDDLAVIISMVSQIINIISIALIAFTSLSLVVSTVMLSIITYVSVIERIKEIGIIRALGGRKKDVSHLFNAETLMIGLASGIFGILITYLIQIILNAVVHHFYPPITAIAALPVPSALLIILIAVALTMVAGILPALSAARKDPVEALRSE